MENIAPARLVHRKDAGFPSDVAALRRRVTPYQINALKMTPNVRERWKRCEAGEHRRSTNKSEVLVQPYAWTRAKESKSLKVKALVR